MLTGDQNSREHLGRLLAARRAGLAPRYRNRRTFATETGLGWRTLYDIEEARRANFKPKTLRELEDAYRLVPGSLDRFGGELEPLPDVRPEPRPAIVPAPLPAIPDDLDDGDPRPIDPVLRALLDADPDVRRFWFLEFKGRRIPREERVALIRLILEWVGGESEPGNGHAESA